jgi:hypothetical protein
LELKEQPKYNKEGTYLEKRALFFFHLLLLFNLLARGN